MSRGRALLRRFRANQQAADQLADAASASTAKSGKLHSRRSGEGDPARMRGIPIQGARGVPGTMRGTRPDAWIDQLPDDEE